MKIFNVTDVNDIFELKFFIENKLLENNEIETKFELGDFVMKYMNISKKTYVYNDLVTPFEYYEFNDEKILIIGENDVQDKIINILKQINFDFKNLVELSKSEIALLIGEPSYEFFIIENKYYSFN